MVYLSVVYHKIVWNFNATSGLWEMNPEIPEAYDQFCRYGRESHESYCDRKTGTDVGRYTAALKELEHGVWSLQQ